ncbi:hypothetical protein CC86DRAFT_468276 [Ophiobolus disseminans]|uniref:F-box domain-containing protein n=1 Tax=Ophiobolus disseminans TaxID=1469910 RepID=A0A6A6ZXG5_9PLEO|nr:hypothetical protein CC86DRAFT_468276 [Ophiobolus disseminans]
MAKSIRGHKHQAQGALDSEQHSTADFKLKSGSKNIEGCGFLKLPGELRNWIYDIILAQTSKDRIWVSHKPRKLRAQAQLLRPWNSACPHIGLAQVCRVSRNEFWPLYFDHLQYLMDVNDLDTFADTFNLSDIQISVGAIVEALKQVPLPAGGVNVFPLIKYMLPPEGKIELTRTSKKHWDNIDLVVRLHRYFSGGGGPFAEWSYAHQVTEVTLQHRLVSMGKLQAEICYATVVSIRVEPELDASRSAMKLDEVGTMFITATGLHGRYQIIVEGSCGIQTRTWLID